MDAENFVAERDLGLIEKLAAALGCNPDPPAIKRLAKFVELVAVWNRRFDLTAARGPAEQAEVLLADALVLSDPGLVPEGSRLTDIGSGAGAPALPLLVLRDDVTAVLLEPKQKRVALLNTAIGSLELEKRARVLRGRLDPADPRVEGRPFDVALSRATFPPEEWLPAGALIARLTLVLTASAEPPAAPPTMERGPSREYCLPGSGARRCITVYRNRLS